MPLSPESVNPNSAVAEHLFTFDFSFGIDTQGPGWFSIDGVDDITQIGSDGAGGSFVLLPSQQVLYVSSEGQAGIIAADFEEFIQLIVALPYWQSILSLSAGGDVNEMQRAANWLEEADIDDENEVNAARDFVRSELHLPKANDPVIALHAAISGSDAIVRAPDGHPYSTLLGTSRVPADANQ